MKNIFKNPKTKYVLAGLGATTIVASPFITLGIKKSSESDIVIGAKSFAESAILANIAKQTIEHYTNGIKISVDVKSNLQSSQMPFLLDRNVISGLAEYTGSIMSAYWIEPQNGYTSEEIRKWTVDDWAREIPKVYSTSRMEALTGAGTSQISGIGYNNGYEIIVRADDADFFDENGAQKVNTVKEWVDAMGGSTLVTDATYPDAEIGLNFLVDLYKGQEPGTTDGLSGKSAFKDLGPSVQVVDSSTNRYEFLKQGSAKSIIGYTTDPQLLNEDLKVLKLSDASDAFPTYDSFYIFNKYVLEKYSKIKNVLNDEWISLKWILNKINIDYIQMTNLNQRVQLNKENVAKVVNEFLSSDEVNFFE